MTDLERLMAKVQPVPWSGCWLWLGGLSGRPPGQYGQSWLNGRQRKAHCVVYELLKGPIPEGMDLDHLCKVRLCVNPEHLEAVPRLTNILRSTLPAVTKARHARRTHCPQGHPYDEANTLWQVKRYSCGEKLGRVCLTCKRAHARRYKAKRKLAQ